ncbi:MULTISPECIES: DUF599 domain-containing protein [unclassified Gilvimarinus]|uniref:DUF599 domain-containing protein n=1 Tax=unclassified Gilvimarinus TaxID=2642066 RepID=UPI0026E480F8|nr:MULTISPECIES: DUF599 domain-containing protein [unclassified Gilvimarinus]MDO6570117.1 DUF599 domain-containing protein [Gilvimarinus sp. 2_MG-2023]MDO6748289.1 DUF599 domain-containing protein [Gilvimarinus sp. 1_MG-2023]
MSTYDWINLCAALWLFVAWTGYARFARKRARTDHCLASTLHVYRKSWMIEMLGRQNRIADTALVASLERNVSFLASTSILIIAGLVTIMASIDKVYITLSALPFANDSMTPRQLQLKVILLLMIYVYAFFTLTWAMRQYGFCAILFGAAPAHDADISTEEKRRYAISTAKIIDQAGHSYNYGLRAYYFSLAVLPWFFNTWLFIAAVATVVGVLYRREFQSTTLRTLAYDLKLPPKA